MLPTEPDSSDATHADDERLERLLRGAAVQATSAAELLELLVRQPQSDARRRKRFSAQLARLNGDRIVIEALVDVELDARASRELSSPGMSLPIVSSVVYEVESAGAACRWDDILQHPDLHGFDRLVALNIRSVISTRFRTAGTAYYLTLASKNPGDFDETDQAYLESVASILEKHLYAAWQAERIRHQAAHDPLTGLFNRQRFRSSLRAVLAANEECAVVVFDLADFRSINQRVGDMVGDALLVEVGAFLAADRRFGDIVSRLGGDVFGMCLPGIGTRAAATRILEPILVRFREGFSTGDRTGLESIRLAVRVGVALQPSDGKTADELLAGAHAAVNGTKDASPGHIAFYDAAVETADLQPLPQATTKARRSVLWRFEINEGRPDSDFGPLTRFVATALRVPHASIRVHSAHHNRISEEPFSAHVNAGAPPFVVLDAANDPRFRDEASVGGDSGIRFFAGVAPANAEQSTSVIVSVTDQVAHTDFGPADEALLAELARVVAAELGLRQSAGFFDASTGLPNYAQLRDDLDTFIDDPLREAEALAVVIVDTAEPGRYDELERTLGHGYSDKFVLASAHLVRSVIPDHVKLYNLGPYRFALVLSDTDLDASDEIMRRIAAALALPLHCADILVATSGSVGAAYFPAHSDSGEGLIRAAISATHEARSDPRGWAKYDTIRDTVYRRAFQLLGDLPIAIAGRGQLSMVYQPTIDLRSGVCVGAEALVRWKHPEFGSVPPMEFVALAERTGIVRPLTDWVFAETIAQLAIWGSPGFKLKIGINASMLDLEDREFAERVSTLLARFNVPPGAIEIELTESALIRNDSIAAWQMSELVRLGIDIAIDDFGTGQSAHSYLKRIPAAKVKIDQSFVRSVPVIARDQMIVGSMIELAHGFGYRVVAEGIETADVRDWLAENDCDLGQGYLFARPLDAVSFVAWLAARPENRPQHVPPA